MTPVKTFLLPVLDRWLVHAPLHGVTALVNGAAAARLRSGVTAGDGGRLSTLMGILAAKPEKEPQPIQGEIVPSFLGILPTRGCNIRCTYCHFGGPNADGAAMDPRIAVAAIDWMAERVRCSGGDTLAIEFFGGEPFTAPDAVDVVVHRARAAAAERGLATSIAATTNGVFDEARCRFIGDYFSSIALSLDGPPEIHDRNRPARGGRPTYPIVERSARLLSEAPVELCLRLCVTAESVTRLREITDFMCQSFRPAVIDFETLTAGIRAARAGLVPPDPYAFARHFLGAVQVAERHGIRAICSTVDLETPRLSSCPVATDALIVSPDGRASACYLPRAQWRARGLDLDLGRVYPDGRVDIDDAAVDRTRRLPLAKPRCAACFCRFSCAGGCHVNQTFPGCDPGYSDYCIQTRLITAGLLLKRLGQEELVQELLADRGRMEALALQAGDAVRGGRSRPATSAEVNAWQQLSAEPFEPECLTVHLSNACNLRCGYCFAARDGRRSRRGRPKLVDLEAVRIAADAVARHCARSGRSFQLVVHGGGEPTLHWELLQDIVRVTRKSAHARGVGWRSYVATNATLSEDRARWLAAAFDRVGVSCDGPPDIQDAQRPGIGGRPTSKIVARTVQILAAAAEVTVRVTVTPESVRRQAEIVTYVHRELGVTDIRLEPVYLLGETGFEPEDAPLFARHYLAARRRAEILGCRVSLAGTRPEEVHGPFCNVLRGVLQLTPGGELTSCFLATGSGADDGPFKIGYVDQTAQRVVLDRERIADLRRRAVSIPARCRGCEIVHQCARDCPDVCLLIGQGDAERAGFRCRVQKLVASDSLRSPVASRPRKRAGR